MDNAITVPFEYDDLTQPQETKTYKMDYRHKRITGIVDEKEAVMQAIWKILSTTRFAHLIYDDQYGFDLWNKFGTGLTKQYLDTDIPQMTEDALLSDDRITGVSDFQYEILSSDSVHIEFTVSTIYGDMRVEGVIADGSYQY